MATNATAIAIPNPTVAAAFTDGELAITPGAIAAGTRYLAKQFILQGGTYTVKLWGADIATLWVGQEMASNRRVAISRLSDAGATTAEFFAQQGVHRIGITLVALSAITPYFAMAIYQQGRLVYASAAAGWVFDAAPIPDADLPSAGDPRLALPVWSVSPNWASGVTERLSYLTEVIPSETAVEQRRSLRRYPRRSIEADFLRKGPARQRIDSFLAGVGRRKFLVPLWMEQTRTPNIVSPGGLVLNFPTGTLALREFAVGDVVLIGGRDPALYDVSTVASIVGDTMTLGVAPTMTWPTGSRITPLRVARFDDPPSVSNVTSAVGTAQARFELDEPDRSIVPDWGYCAPLWRFKIDRSNAIDTGYERNAYVFDVDTGRVEIVDPGDTTRVVVKANITLFGRQNLRAFRQFLAMARGKAVRFWFPSGTHDLEPVGTIGGVTLDVQPVGYSAWLRVPQEARLMLAFTFTDGRPTVYRKILDVSAQTGFDRLTLDGALPTVERRFIDRVSYVLPVRFDQDTFELTHITSNAKAVRAAVVVRSSEIDGLPPIDCWLTSMPYPVQINEDALQMSATILGGGGFNAIVEALDMAGTITSGSFPEVLRTQDAGFDAMDVSPAITGGSFPIIVTYRDYEGDPEALDVAAQVTSGTLVQSLVTTVMDIDSLDTSATITGGTLT